MISIATKPNLRFQRTPEGPVILWPSAIRRDTQGLLVVVHPCELLLDSPPWHVDLTVYALVPGSRKVELDGGRAWVVDRAGSRAPLEPAYRATVTMPDITLVADRDADPEYVFWVDEALDEELLGVIEEELERGMDRAEAALRREEVSPRPLVGRNERCPCGSGKKYKRCCLGAA